MIPGVMAGGMHRPSAAGTPQNLKFLASTADPPGVYFEDDGKTFKSGSGAGGNWWKTWSAAHRKAGSGSFYFEVLLAKHVKSNANLAIGIAPAGTGSYGNAGDQGRLQYFDDGRKRNWGSYEAYAQPFNPGDRIGVAISTAGLEFFLNGVSQGIAYSSAYLMNGGEYEPHFCHYTNATTDEVALKLSDSLLYLPPGFEPWA